MTDKAASSATVSAETSEFFKAELAAFARVAAMRRPKVWATVQRLQPACIHDLIASRCEHGFRGSGSEAGCGRRSGGAEAGSPSASAPHLLPATIQASHTGFAIEQLSAPDAPLCSTPNQEGTP